MDFLMRTHQHVRPYISGLLHVMRVDDCYPVPFNNKFHPVIQEYTDSPYGELLFVPHYGSGTTKEIGESPRFLTVFSRKGKPMPSWFKDGIGLLHATKDYSWLYPGYHYNTYTVMANPNTEVWDIISSMYPYHPNSVPWEPIDPSATLAEFHIPRH